MTQYGGTNIEVQVHDSCFCTTLGFVMHMDKKIPEIIKKMIKNTTKLKFFLNLILILEA